MPVEIRGYQAGDEVKHIALERQLIADWPWPFAFSYTDEDLLRQVSDPAFDPELHFYAVDNERIVGFSNVWGVDTEADGSTSAFLLYPKMLPDYEDARLLLVGQASQALHRRGVKTLTMWGCSMFPGSYEWLGRNGFTETADRPRGYKIYMTYDLSKGALSTPSDWVHPVQSKQDLQDAARLASIWFKSPVEWCQHFIEEEMRVQWNVVSHLLVSEEGRSTAACIVARNDLRPSLAAFYNIYAENPRALRQLVSKAISECRAQGLRTLLVDLIYEHRHFEPTYTDLGFEMKVDYAMYEKQIG